MPGRKLPSRPTGGGARPPTRPRKRRNGRSPFPRISLGWLKLPLLVLLALVLVAGALFYYYLATSSLPQVEGEVSLTGLMAPVHVLRDRFGIPHLYGQSADDLVRAQGFVHAQDRLFQMELARRIGQGTLADLLGRPALLVDRLVRRRGLPMAARAEMERMDPDARRLLDAYADGVNAYIEARKNDLPPEFRFLRRTPSPWSAHDSLAIAKWMSLILSSNGSAELLRARIAERVGLEEAYRVTGLTPPPPEAAPPLLSFPPPAEPWPSGARSGASNAWVVSGDRSASTRPMLASDPHLELGVPAVWYEIQLTGGGLDVVGASLPGLPLVIIGHNERIAWGITALYADVQDYYVETLNPADPRQYAVGEQWEELRTTVETISVAGEEAVSLELARTRHGPVVSEAAGDGRVLVLRWDSLWRGDTALALYRLNLAHGWGDFTEALRSLASPALAFVYADVEGNIGFFPSGDIPLRSGFDGTLPVDGALDAYEWQGSLAHEMKPILFNPQEGLIVTANHALVPDEAPYGLGRDQLAPFRADRITTLLSAQARHSLVDFVRIQADQYDASSESILKYAVALRADAEGGEPAIESLRRWSGQMSAGAAPAIYQALYLRLLENTFKDELGEEVYRDFLDFVEQGHYAGIYPIVDDSGSAWWDDRATSEVETRDGIFGRSLTQALEWLETRQGGDMDRWDWAALHAVQFQHPLGGVEPLGWLFNRGPVRFGGSTFTIANALVSLTDPFAAPLGTSFRMVVDLGALESGLSAIPTGASGHPFSDHYFDQNETWRTGDSHPLFFIRSDVEAALEATLTLNP